MNETLGVIGELLTENGIEWTTNESGAWIDAKGLRTIRVWFPPDHLLRYHRPPIPHGMLLVGDEFFDISDPYYALPSIVLYLRKKLFFIASINGQP